MADISTLKDMVASGRLPQAKALVDDAISAGMDPQEIIDGYLVKGMEEIGEKFEKGLAFVPNLLLAARAMKGCLDILTPLMKDGCASSLGTVVIGTVKGDLHDIGKNLVASMLEGCGFKVVNLGTDVSAQKFIDAVREYDARIVCLSALLTTTMTYMKEIVDAFVAEGLREKVRIMVGGAPVNAAFASQVGADGYSANANEAVALAKSLLSE